MKRGKAMQQGDQRLIFLFMINCENVSRMTVGVVVSAEDGQLTYDMDERLMGVLSNEQWCALPDFFASSFHETMSLVDGVLRGLKIEGVSVVIDKIMPNPAWREVEADVLLARKENR
jgi:hypothetical protein